MADVKTRGVWTFRNQAGSGRNPGTLQALKITIRKMVAAIVSLPMVIARPAIAEEWLDTAAYSTLPQSQYVISLGAGGQVKPRYPGADNYLLSPFPIIKVERFYLPGFGQVVDGKKKGDGFSFYPSFSFVGDREASDSVNLTGTNTIDWAFEAGLGLRYQQDWARGFIEFRQGFNGHDGQVGTIGFDVITKPAENVELVFGPRLNWGSEDFTNTYFGVTAAEAAAIGSLLVPYNAGSGFNSVGVEAEATYAWDDRTTLHFRAGWERLIGDAADSPIVMLGEEDQFTAGAGISYRLDFDLFNTSN